MFWEALGLFKKNTGVVSSPNYPDIYPENLQRIQTIQVEEGQVVALQFIAHSFADTFYCGDQLTIFDGDETALMNKSCGSTSTWSSGVEVGGINIGSLLPANITSTTNTVRLVFKTDNESKYARTGWSISWRAVEQGWSWLLINYH